MTGIKSLKVTLKIASSELRNFPEIDTLTPKAKPPGVSRKKDNALKPATPHSKSRASAARSSQRNSTKKSVLSSPAPADSPLKTETTETPEIDTPGASKIDKLDVSSVNTMSALSKEVITASANSVTSGNSTGSGAEAGRLDKTGNPVRKWIKRAVTIQSFTGFSVDFQTWTGSRKEGDEKSKELGNIKKQDGGGFKVQIRLNNRKLDPHGSGFKEKDLTAELDTPVDSRDGSPGVTDEASSMVSTPLASGGSTPIP